MIDNTLDLTSLTCPWPIIKTKQVMNKLTSKEILLVIVNEPSFIIDCIVYVNRTGHKLLCNWHNGNNIYCLLQKN